MDSAKDQYLRQRELLFEPWKSPKYHFCMEKEMKPTLQFRKIIFCAGEFGEECSLPDLLGTEFAGKKDYIQDPDVEVGYGMKTNSYPYRQQAGYNRELHEIELDTAVLENDFLYAEFLPSLGGRLWKLTDKMSGRDLIYHNDVIRFSNLAVCNAWFSGGVEWNISLIGHSPFTARPLFAEKLCTEDDIPVLRMYEFERVREAVFQMDFWLGEQDKFLNCRMRICNMTDHEIPMYWWSNMAVPEYPGGRIAVPANSAFTGNQEKVWKVDIPLVDHIDISRYENIPYQVDYFFDIPTTEHKFIANIDEDGKGLLHISTDRLQSRKLFCWGHDIGSKNWQKFLTNHAGNYIEIQAGVSKTQYGCMRMPARAEWEWLEQYGAISIDREIIHAKYQTFLDHVKKVVEEHWNRCDLSKVLEESRNVANHRGELIQKGSKGGACFNAIANATGAMKISDHLNFAEEEYSSSVWMKFIRTGILPDQNPNEPPEDFACSGWIYRKLEESIKPGKQNEKNWFAWYALGCMLLSKEQNATYLCEARRVLGKAYGISRNPWTLEALAVLSMKENNKDGAVQYILCGSEMRPNDIQYLKTAGAILLKAKAYREWMDFYESLEPEVRSDPRLYFDYITAMAGTGEKQKAYNLLNSTEDMFLDDLKECEGSIEDLWQELHMELFGKKGDVPLGLRFISGDEKIKG